MKKAIVILLVAIVGIGAGLAAGIFITNSKNKVVIADMQTQMKKEQVQTQERIHGYDIIVGRLNSELQLAKAEIEMLKTPPAPTAPPVAETAIPATENTTAAATTTDSTATANTTQYTIQSGDSLWSIAQKQLGNGSRFKEILKLNPKISAKGNLAVGSKLKLPAK